MRYEQPLFDQPFLDQASFVQPLCDPPDFSSSTTPVEDLYARAGDTEPFESARSVKIPHGIPQRPWMVSLHGGHCGEFCDHAEATLVEMLEAAVAAGYVTFGVSEHVPRIEDRFLYPKEIELGWSTDKINADFERYTSSIQIVAHDFSDRITILRGFEAEVVPTTGYAERVRAWRDRTDAYGNRLFDYCVGSVHYVSEISIDGTMEEFQRAVEAAGGPEALSVAYYRSVAEMIEALRPDVVGHLDLVKLNLQRAGYSLAILDMDPVRRAAECALESARAYSSILDLNTAGWRKGLGEPYPSKWLVAKASSMEVPFCFGDDSHRPSDVGYGMQEARDYLCSCNVTTVTVLEKSPDRPSGELIPRVISLLQD